MLFMKGIFSSIFNFLVIGQSVVNTIETIIRNPLPVSHMFPEVGQLIELKFLVFMNIHFIHFTTEKANLRIFWRYKNDDYLDNYENMHLLKDVHICINRVIGEISFMKVWRSQSK